MILIADARRHLSDAPASSALLDGWCQWAADDGIPTVDAVRPELLGAFLPNVTVFNIERDGGLGYSLVGARQRDLLAEDVRGRSLSALTPDEALEERGRRMKALIEYPCGMIARGTLRRESGAETAYTSIMLPMRTVLDALPTKIYHAIDVARETDRSATPDPVRSVPLATWFRFVDLGYGAPAA